MSSVVSLQKLREVMRGGGGGQRMYLLSLEVNGWRTANAFRKQKLYISDGLLIRFRSYDTKKKEN